MTHIINHRSDVPACSTPIVYDIYLHDRNFAHILYSINEYLTALETVKRVNPLADISKVMLIIDIIGLTDDLVKTRYYSQVECLQKIMARPNADMIDIYILAGNEIPSMLKEG